MGGVEKKFADPVYIGPGTWRALHLEGRLAKNYERKRWYLTFVDDTINNFPCSDCRNHAQNYLKNDPPVRYWNYTDSNGNDIGMFYWSWKFHNFVNARLGKPQLDFNTAYAMYAPPEEGGIGICTADCDKGDKGKDISSSQRLEQMPGAGGKVNYKPSPNPLIRNSSGFIIDKKNSD